MMSPSLFILKQLKQILCCNPSENNFDFLSLHWTVGVKILSIFWVCVKDNNNAKSFIYFFTTEFYSFLNQAFNPPWNIFIFRYPHQVCSLLQMFYQLLLLYSLQDSAYTWCYFPLDPCRILVYKDHISGFHY